jgi:hypothetical protein
MFNIISDNVSSLDALLKKEQKENSFKFGALDNIIDT